MSRSRIRPLSIKGFSQPKPPAEEKKKTHALSRSGVVPLRMELDLVERVDAWLIQNKFTKRQRSSWIRDAVINFAKVHEESSPLELVGDINLYRPELGTSSSLKVIHVMYDCEGKQKAARESSKAFVSALEQLMELVGRAPISKFSPERSRTDIVVSACKYYLGKLQLDGPGF